MITGLMHGRLLVAAGAGGVVSSPAYPRLSGYAYGPTKATAEVDFSVNPDGTWSATASGASPVSGNWYSPTQAAVGAGYEVRITPTHVSGSGGVVDNPASSWVTLDLARRLNLLVHRFTAGTTSSSYDVLVEIRPVGFAAASSARFVMSASAEVTDGNTQPL